jgi:hypothetical protein
VSVRHRSDRDGYRSLYIERFCAAMVGGQRESAGRRGHCLMLAWVFPRNVTGMWRIGARHDEDEFLAYLQVSMCCLWFVFRSY